MKKIYFLLVFCLGLNLNAQIITFSDTNFKARLLQSDVSNNIAGYIKIDANNDGEIEVSEIQNVTYLNIAFSGISDLTSLNYFNLFGLNCSYNAISNLNWLSQPYLEQLNCSNNQLTELSITGIPSLVDLNCSNNYIETLDLSQLGFTDALDIHNNNISSFFPPEYIVSLDIRNNNFNGFSIPNFTIQAILVFGGNPSDQLIYNSSWRAPKELVFSSATATTVDLSNVPIFSYETDEGQPNFYFFNCSLLESIQLNNNLLSRQYYGALTIEDCGNLNLICADSGEEAYFTQRLTELNLSSQVSISIDCRLTSPDLVFSDYFVLSPNPAKEVLNFKIKNAIQISSINIYNALGQLVSIISNAKDINLVDVSSLKSGTYFLKINSDRGTTNAKFIKE